MIKRKFALIVGEDTGTRECIAQALERTGFQPLAVADATESSRAGLLTRDVELLVTSVVLEAGSGLEFAAQFRRASPRVKVIYVSGCNDPVRIGCALDPASEYLTRPFTSLELMAKVRALFRCAARDKAAPTKCSSRHRRTQRARAALIPCERDTMKK